MPLASRRKSIGVRDAMSLDVLNPVSREIRQWLHTVEHFVEVVAVLIDDNERIALDLEPTAALTALLHIEDGAVLLDPTAIRAPGVHDHGDDLGRERFAFRPVRDDTFARLPLKHDADNLPQHHRASELHHAPSNLSFIDVGHVGPGITGSY